MLSVSHLRRTARMAVFVVCVPFLAGCGGGNQGPANTMRTEDRATQPPQGGMSTKQKVVALAGAAALYYVYKKYQENKANPSAMPSNVRQAIPQGVQLYRSESTGAIYYREPNNPQKVHWLTLPNNRIEVPQNEYDQIMSQRNAWRNMPVPTAGSVPGPGQL